MKTKEEKIKFVKELVYLKIDDIVPNKNQPRKIFDEENLDELASSISKNGLLQPISVRYNGSKYELVAGERRLRASKKIGLTHIPTIITNATEEKSAVIALIENIQRKDLNYIEEAESYMNILGLKSITQEQLANKIGKSQSTVANKLRLLKLTKEIRETLINNGLSERHARALLKIDNEKEQKSILNVVIQKGMNIKQTELYIEKVIEKNNASKRVTKRQKVTRVIKDIRLLTSTIDEAINFMNVSKEIAKYDVENDNGKYRIVIDVDLTAFDEKNTEVV